MLMGRRSRPYRSEPGFTATSRREPTSSRSQPFGLPTGQATTLQLAPGTGAYLNVDWVSSWTQGYPPASWNFAPNTFAILKMPTQVAQAYLPTLGYLGER